MSNRSAIRILLLAVGQETEGETSSLPLLGPELVVGQESFRTYLQDLFGMRD